MANFVDAFNFMLPHEGGLSNNPKDPGGLTKFGISRKSYPDLDIEALTIPQAEEIYRRDFWEPNCYGAIDDQAVANKAFDLAVNMGPGTANKILQHACNACGATLNVDGQIGPKTIDAVNSTSNIVQLLNMLKVLAVEHYQELVVANPALRVFLKGWTARAQE